jgi:hypothetical protein
MKEEQIEQKLSTLFAKENEVEDLEKSLNDTYKTVNEDITSDT